MEVRKGSVIINVDDDFMNTEWGKEFLTGIACVIHGIVLKRDVGFLAFFGEKLLGVIRESRKYLKEHK